MTCWVRSYALIELCLAQRPADEHAYGLREQAAKQLVPQLDFKYAEDLKRAEMIHGVLAGFGLAENLPAIRKRGHLDLQSQLNPGFWKRQFFTLRKARPSFVPSTPLLLTACRTCSRLYGALFLLTVVGRVPSRISRSLPTGGAPRAG